MTDLLDKLIAKIKQKGDSVGFKYGDYKIILALEIVRLEISATGKFSDLSLRAIKEISSMTSYETYKYDHPELYDYLHVVFEKLKNFNSNFSSADIDIIGFEHEKWCNFFGGAIRYFLDEVKP